MATQKGRNWSSGDIVTAANLSSIERGVSALAENYTPTTWANGDTVTAAALNKIEQGIANAGGGSWTVLTEESVTTAVEGSDPYAYGEFAYSEQITADTIKVTFNGTEYTCNKTLDDGENLYGGEWSDAIENFDFSTYPFGVASSGSTNYLYTETAGTYSVKIEAPAESGSSDFSTATVTVINNASDDTTLMNAINIGDDSLNSDMIINKDETLPVPAVLYKSEARWAVQEYAVAVTGNATATIITTIPITITEILITGDCTITISNSLVA